MNSTEYAAHLLKAERTLSRNSPMLRRLIRTHGPCTLKPRWRQSIYQSLVEAVIYQQLNGKAAETILQRFVALFPDIRFPEPTAVLAADDDHLRSAGLSRQKATYIRDIAQRTVEGVVPLKRSDLHLLSDDEIVARITRVKGVGRWTVEMMLMFTLGRLDVLPVDDFGVRKGFSKADKRSEQISPRELGSLGEAWAPYRSVAAWYFWREADTK